MRLRSGSIFRGGQFDADASRVNVAPCVNVAPLGNDGLSCRLSNGFVLAFGSVGVVEDRNDDCESLCEKSNTRTVGLRRNV